MNLLGAKLYDPAGAVSKATSSLIAMTAFDTSNLRLTVTVPAHGFLLIKMRCAIEGATTFPQVLLGVLDGATVRGRVQPIASLGGTALATTRDVLVAEFTIPGLTPGSMTLDAAYGVEIVVAATNIKYGGPNNTTTDDAWGAFVFEIYDPQPIPIAAPGAAGGLFIAGSNALTNVNFISNITGTWVGNISGAVGQLQTNLDKSGYGLLNNQIINISGTITNVYNVLNPITIGTNNDKTGYSLSSPQSFNLIGNISGTHIGNQIGNISGAVGQIQTNLDKLGYSLSSPQMFNLIGNITGTFMGNISGTVGAVNGLVPSRLDVPVSSRMATGTLINSNLIQIDGQATNGNNATLNLKQLNIVNNSGHALIAQSTGNDGSGIRALGNGLGHGMDVRSGNSDFTSGMLLYGGTGKNAGLEISGGDTGGQGMLVYANDDNQHGLDIVAAGTGKSINAPQNIAISDGDLTLANIASGTWNAWTPRIITGLITGTFIDAIADKVWDEQISGHLITGSTGEKLNSAGAAGDPWSTNLPNGYIAGTAGYILGTNLDAKVSSRMASGTVLVGDKTGFSLLSPQVFNLIGNITGTLVGNVQGYVGTVTGSVGSVVGLNPDFIDTYISSRMPSGTVFIADKTGFSLLSPQMFDLIGNISGSISNVIGLNSNYLDVPVSSRLSSGTFASNYVVPPTANQNAIAVLNAASANPIESNVKQVNDTNITGDGSAGNHWRRA